MVALAKGSTTDISNPVLVFYAQEEGQMVDLDSLRFQIFDQSTEEKRITPVQVWPTTPGNKQSVDLVEERLSLGRYAPSWTAPAPTGRYQVRWFWTLTAGGQERSARQVFEVLNGEPLGGPAYTLVSDLRGDCDDQKASEDRLQSAVLVASSFVQGVTARFFEPRYALQRFDGNGSRALVMNDPVIAVESLSIDTQPSTRGALPVDLDEVRIFNRHLSQRMTNPDDRDSPKLEFVHGRDMFQRSGIGNSFLASYIFPYGVQNIAVPGVFGYTEWDGTPFGKTPELIQLVTRQIALRSIPGDDQCREEMRNGWRVIEQRTRDQMIRYADPRKFGQWTGDPDIDSILTMFIRPPNLGSA